MAGVDQRDKGGGPASTGETGRDAVVSLERALVRRAQSGDRAAIRELLARHADALFSRVVLPRVGDVPLAEDLLKSTMATAIEKLHSFRWQGRSIYFWLRQIAVNKVIDHHRRVQRQRRLADRLAAEADLAAVIPTAPAGPEAALLAAEERRINRRRIEGVLRQINPRYRRAIELRLVQERSRDDCAAEMGVAIGTFDVLFFRAVKAFRRAFAEKPDDE